MIIFPVSFYDNYDITPKNIIYKLKIILKYSSSLLARCKDSLRFINCLNVPLCFGRNI